MENNQPVTLQRGTIEPGHLYTPAELYQLLGVNDTMFEALKNAGLGYVEVSPTLCWVEGIDIINFLKNRKIVRKQQGDAN